MSKIVLNHVSVDIPLWGLSRSRINDPRIARSPTGELIVNALRDISFEAKPGDRIGIYGSNGSGKTTLLKTLAGILPVNNGEILITGDVHAILNLSDGIRYSLTGRQNARLRYYLLGKPGGTEEDFINNVLEFADLRDFFDLPVNIYSPGMLGRLLFAMSTIKRADILLLDEWIGVADQVFQNKVAERIDDLVKSNDIFVVASHSRDIIENTTNRIIRLEEGRITRAHP